MKYCPFCGTHFLGEEKLRCRCCGAKEDQMRSVWSMGSVCEPDSFINKKRGSNDHERAI